MGADGVRIRAQTYRQAFGSAGAQQLIIFLVAAMILDGGLLLEVCLFAAASFWVGAAVIWFRRRGTPTTLDLLLIEAGNVPLCVLGFFLSYWIWSRRGAL